MNPNLPALFDQAPIHEIVRQRSVLKRNGAILAGVAVLLVAILVLALLDERFAWAEMLRLWLVGIAGATALSVCLRRWFVGKKGQDAKTLVREMETAQPSEGQRLRTAWEVASHPAPESATDEQKAFSSQLLADAQRQVSSGTWTQLVPTAHMKRWLMGCGAIIAAMLVLAQQWPDFRTALWRVIMPLGAPTYTSVAWESSPTLFDDRHPPRFAATVAGRPATPELHIQAAGSTEWQTHPLSALADGRTFDTVLTGMAGDFQVRVTAGDGATLPHQVRYRPIPRLEEAKVTIRYPDYTGLEPEERQGGDASVVEGSTLGWTFRFNTPPDRVEWKLASDTSGPQTVAVQTDGPTVNASWKAPLGKYSGVLTILDKDGSTVDSWRYEIAGLADKLPTVELLEPVKDIQATCVTELPVRIRARDDFGVAEIGLIMEAAGQTIWTLEKVIDERDQRDISELTRAMLEKVPLTINDNIKLYAYALDHKPRGGPRSVSALRAIDIRDFKRLERMASANKPPAVNPQQFAKLNKLITAQRVVVSDCHVIKEEAKDEAAEGIGTKCQETGVKQQEVITQTSGLLTAWQAEPSIPPDDVALLGTAQAQMGETNQYLVRTLTEQAHATSDRALSSLLLIRKHLMWLIGPKCECEDQEESDSEIKRLEELAQEAERLAEEEKSVRQQIPSPPSKPEAGLASPRRQQEVALADGGELFTAIVTHPQKNEPMLNLMAISEKAMREADERIHSKKYLTAQAPLADAEKNLRDLADFIRAMMEEKLADTLKKMAGKAQSDSKKAESKGDAESRPGDSKDGQGPEGKSTETTATKEASPKPSEQAEGDAARNAKLADEILKALADLAAAKGNKEGKGPGDMGEKGSTGADSGMTAAELDALRKRAGTEALAEDLRDLAQQGGGKSDKGDKPSEGKPSASAKPGQAVLGQGDKPKADQKQGKGIAARLEKMARELNAEATRLNASRIARLAQVRDQAKSLRDKAAQDPAAKQAAEDDKLIQQLIAQGFKPGQALNINGKMLTIPAKPAPDSKGELGKLGSPKPEVSRFVAEAKRLGDDPITGLTAQLETAVTPLPALDGIIERLDSLMAALPSHVVQQTAQSLIPEAHRREIEAYFRNLSDDFDNEDK